VSAATRDEIVLVISALAAVSSVPLYLAAIRYQAWSA
jgi:hypothetical protein